MALAAWQATIQDEEGNVIYQPVVTVRNASDGSLADIFNEAGAPLPNPVTGDGGGFVQFFASDGRYDITAVNGNLSSNEWTWDAIAVDLNKSVNFANRADAVAGQTGGYKSIRVGNLEYKHDPDGTALTTADGRKWSPVGNPSPFHFGAVCDGVADDTAQIRALHNYCNKAKIAPNYGGIATFAVDANARIPVNTNVDFNGADAVLSNAFVADADQTFVVDQMNHAFHIYDEATPIVAGISPLNGANFVKGTTGQGKGLMSSGGFLEIQFTRDGNVPEATTRDRNGPAAYTLTFCVDNYGNSEYPLHLDFSGATSGFVIYRLNPSRRVRVGNIRTDMTSWSNGSLFLVMRNRVDIFDVTIKRTPSVPAGIRSNRALSLYRCSDIKVDGLRGDSDITHNIDFSATYSFSATSVAKLKVTDMASATSLDDGGSSFVGSKISGVSFIDCHTNRVEGHEYMANVFVRGGVLSGRGISYGAGGGVLSVSNCVRREDQSTFYPLVSTRVDYCTTWDGVILVDNITIISKWFSTVIVDLTAGGLGNKVNTVRAPSQISITNVHFVYTGTSTTYREIFPIKIDASPNTKGIVAPQSIVVDNITANHLWAVSATLGFNNMLPPPSTSIRGAAISFSNILATDPNGKIVFPDKDVTVTRGDSTIQVVFDRVNNIDLSYPQGNFGSTAARISADQCLINRFHSPEDCYVLISGSVFQKAKKEGSETAAKVANSGTGNSKTFITGGMLQGDFDFSTISGASGVGSRFTGKSIFPSGVTREQMFTGWIAP